MKFAASAETRPALFTPTLSSEGTFTTPSFTLPDTVEEIQKKAFSSCINLSEIRISNSMQLVHKDAFYNCKNLHHVIVPQAISYKKLSEWRIPGKKVSRPKN